MRRWLAVWFAFVVMGPACAGGGGPAPLPFDPFGVEPASGDGVEPVAGNNEAPPPSSGGSIQELCVRACANIAASCPSRSDGGCVDDCATTDLPGCESQYRAFVSCVGNATLSCSADGSLQASACQAAISAVSACAQSTQGGPV